MIFEVGILVFAAIHFVFSLTLIIDSIRRAIGERRKNHALHV